MLEWLHVENLKYLRAVLLAWFWIAAIAFVVHRNSRSKASATMLIVALYVLVALMLLLPVQPALEGDWFFALVILVGAAWLIRLLLNYLASEL